MVYRIALANEALQDHIFQAFFATTPPHIRRVSAGELKEIIRDRALWAVTESGTGDLVAVCYVRDFFSPRRAEFGGLHVKDAHQRTGLARALCVLAVATFLWLNRHSKENVAVLTYVHVDNQRPRKLLKSIGFNQAPGVFPATSGQELGIDLHPRESRLRHMFVLPSSEYCKVFRLAADYLVHGKLEKHHSVEAHLSLGLTAEGLLSICSDDLSFGASNPP